jgi:capsular exopolysaccharide synthesis family protein
VPTIATARTAEKPEPEWLHALNIVRKHWRLSALFVGVVMLTVVLITFSLAPVYEPVARIEVDPPGETFSLEGGNAATDAEYLETQAQNLKSDRLAVDVIRRLHLDQNPAIVPPNHDLKIPDPPANAIAGMLTPQENAALRFFRNNLIVKRDTASRLIAVSFSSGNPRDAALITNTIVDTFIDDTYQQRHDEIMRADTWLARQLDDIRTRMEESNRVLVDFQKTIGVVDIDDNKSTFSEQLSQLNQQLTQAQSDRIQLEALLRSVEAGSPKALPDVRNNPVVQQLSTQLAELRGQLSQTRAVYGPNHPNVKKLQDQINELQSQLNAQESQILSSLKTSYSAARARERLMDSEIKGTSKQLNEMARYNELRKEAQANSELYNSLYAKVKEAGIAAASKSSNLRVVDEARVLDHPTRPRRSLNIMIGLVMGLMGGVAVAFLREQFDNRIFTPEDVRSWIGTSNIAIVPQFFTSSQQLTAGGDSDKINGGLGHRKLAPGVRFLLDRPHSPEAEALRSLYTSVMLSRPGNPPQVVLVVSSFPGEGKTTVSVNLAIAMAEHGKTCLLDADLRRGRVAGAFGVSNEVGLTDVLRGKISLQSALIPVASVPNLTIVPAHPGSVNAGQLVCSDGVRGVMSELREQFQFVVVDSAPILPFADGRALSTLADGLIFVGRAGMTTRDVVTRSLELLNEVHAAPVLEFVLNAADLHSPQYRYYQYGYDYYQPGVTQG